MPRDVGVVIVAAGQGTRLGGEVPKQFRPIAGVPMLLRTLRPFTTHPDVAEAVVVLSPEQAAAPPAWLAELRGSGLKIAAGGATRTESAMAGVGALTGECAIVLVHDGARPFVDRATIDAVIAVARTGNGAVPAVPVGDTIKEADELASGGAILRTVPRERLYRAQTPQGFPRPLLEQAYRRASEAGSIATDDAALVEAMGGPVSLVAGSERNLKVTTAQDLAWAEWLAGTTTG